VTRTRIDVSTQGESGSALCLSCGMCCDGSLFSYAPIDAEDVASACDLGMRVIDTSDDTSRGYGFALPCHLQDGRCCTIHEQWRPGVCSAYSCRLLEEYRAGARSLEDCVSVVASVRQALAEAAHPDEESSSTRTLALATIDVMKRKYFRYPSEPTAGSV
jgi:hypothetical protein